MIYHGRLRYGVLAALGLLYLLLMAFTFNSLGLVLPSMVADLGMDWGQGGFGFTVLGIACGLPSMLPAVTIRLWGVAATLLIGTLLLVGGFVALAASHSVPAYYVGAALMGIGYCFCGTVPSVHIISSMFERRSTALGVYFTAGNIGAVGGPILFYTVSEVLHGWRTYWLICAAVSAVAGILAVAMTRGQTAMAAPASDEAADADALRPETRAIVRQALANPRYWIIVGAYTACLLVNTTMHSFAFQHMMEHGQSKTGATGYMSLAALVAAAAAGVAGMVGEKLEARQMTILALAALTITGLSLAMPDRAGSFAVFAVSVGIGLGLSWVSTALLLQRYFGHRGNLELYSIMTAISTVAAVGPGLGGIVRDHTGSFDAVFAALAVIVATFLAAVAMMRGPAPQNAQTAATSQLVSLGAAEAGVAL